MVGGGDHAVDRVVVVAQVDQVTAGVALKAVEDFVHYVTLIFHPG